MEMEKPCLDIDDIMISGHAIFISLLFQHNPNVTFTILLLS